MITVSAKTLELMGFNPESSQSAVQVVRTKITTDDAVKVRPGAGVELINELLGTELTHKDVVANVAAKLAGDYELMLAQGVAEAVVKARGEPIDPDAVLAGATMRVERLLNSPRHQWLFAKATVQSTTGPVQTAAVISDVDVKVAVNGDGTIKKGGREVLAKALYQKRVIDAGVPVTNQEYIKMLCDELGMTKAGATTYAWNIDKQMGNKLVKKQRGAK